MHITLYNIQYQAFMEAIIYDRHHRLQLTLQTVVLI